MQCSSSVYSLGAVNLGASACPWNWLMRCFAPCVCVFLPAESGCLKVLAAPGRGCISPGDINCVESMTCMGWLDVCSKGLSDASIRQFLARGREGSKADEGGPSQLDIRDLRSLSLSFPSFSVLGPPIGVSLPDSDLRDLRNFISAGQSSKVPPYLWDLVGILHICGIYSMSGVRGPGQVLSA